MIGFFPDPYPDELLYSVCARFADRVQYRGKSSVIRELFGTRNAVAIVDFPCRLGHLVDILPSGHHYTVDRFIDDHTLLPFYSPFCPPQRINQVREDMRGSNGCRIYGRLGILVNRPADWLQFCPICVNNDIQKFGECYWHRVHQLPGVKVCPIHGVFLEESQAHIRHRQQPWELIAAQNILPSGLLPRELSVDSKNSQALLQIAQNAAWLLSQPQLILPSSELRQRYLKRLFELELATYRGYVYARQLLVAFINFYSLDFLDSLDCSIDLNSSHHWLFRLTRFSVNKIQSPLHHLLLIHFLGYTAAEFFGQQTKFQPFGEPPWPCLNRASDHFGQLQISECRLTYNHQQKSRKPVGTFYCSCGFVYSRTGPDYTELDRFRIDKLKCYGSVWEAALTQFWLDESLSVPEIARRLGVSFDTVKRHAAKLNLPLTRPGSQFKPLSEAQKLQPNPIEMASSTLEIYRQEWMEVRTNYPETSRKMLRFKFNRLYVWLEQYDAEWFEAHLPPRFCRVGISPIQSVRVDWLSRDLQLAAQVRESANRLLHTTGHPIRITRTTIGKDIGQRTLIQKEIHKLPLTASALVEVVETHLEYAIRRLEWATQCFLQEKIYPKRWQLLQRASLKPNTVALPLVQQAIEAALASLEPLRND